MDEHPVISMMLSPSRGMKMSAPDSALSRETVAPFVPTILALESEEKRRKKQGRKVSYARSEKKTRKTHKEDWGRPAMIPMNAFSSADLIASWTVLMALSRACWFLDFSVHSTISSPCRAYRGKISKR